MWSLRVVEDEILGESGPEKGEVMQGIDIIAYELLL